MPSPRPSSTARRPVTSSEATRSWAPSLFTSPAATHRTGAPNPIEVAHYLSARGNFSTAPFKVGRFVLMSSRDSVGGGPYIVEEAWPLTGADSRQAIVAASASDASRIMR